MVYKWWNWTLVTRSELAINFILSRLCGHLHLLFLADIVMLLWYLVAGSEDSNVYFYDLTRPKHTCVNKLQVRLLYIQGCNGFLLSQIRTQITIICVTVGSSISRYWGCLEPWRELISIIWFLWYGYCMEEIKVLLKQTYTEIQVSSHTRLCRLFAWFSHFFAQNMLVTTKSHVIVNCITKIREI